MIDYYYELKPGTKLLGTERRYVAQFDYHPETSTAFERHLHNEAMKHSTRVWLNNANGVQEINTYGGCNWRKPVTNTAEFVWIKLQASEII